MRVKKGVYGKFRITREAYENLRQRTEAEERRHPSSKKYANVKDSIRKEGPIIYMEMEDFERELVTVLNEEALKWRDAPDLQTMDAFVKDKPSTRLRVFQIQQADRRGDRAVLWTEQQIRHAIYAKRLKRASVKDGQVTIGNLTFGVEAKGARLSQDQQTLIDWERDARRAGTEPTGVMGLVDSNLEAAVCRLPDGRWLKLPVTRATRAKVGERTRYAVWRMVHRFWVNASDKNRMKKEDAEASLTSKKGGMSSAQRKERDLVKRAALVQGGKARYPRNATAKAALNEERAKQGKRDAEAAEVRGKEAAPARRPRSGYAPRSRLGSGQMASRPGNSQDDLEPPADSRS